MTGDPTTTAAPDRTVRLTPGALAALCVTEFLCLGALMGPIFGGISFRTGLLTGFDDGWEDAKSTVVWTGAGAAILASVLFGMLTDRTARRGRSRARWIPAGSVAGLACLWLAAQADSVGELTLAWVGAQVSYNATFAALYGTLSDLSHPADRTRVGGWFAGSITGSFVIGAGALAWFVPTAPPFPAHTEELLFLPVAVVAVPVAFAAGWYLARQPIRPMPPRTTGSRAGGSFWWLAAQRCLIGIAYGFVTAFGVEALVRRVGLLPGEAIETFALLTAIAAALSMAVAVFVARPMVAVVGSRAVIVAGTAGILGSCLLLLRGTDVPTFAAALLLAGLSIGAFGATDLAAALAVVPDDARGRYLGFFNIARTLPQTLVAVVTPPLLAIGTDVVGATRTQNYFLFFCVGTAFAVISLVAILPLTLPGKDGVAHPRVRDRADARS